MMGGGLEVIVGMAFQLQHAQADATGERIQFALLVVIQMHRHVIERLLSHAVRPPQVGMIDNKIDFGLIRVERSEEHV